MDALYVADEVTTKQRINIISEVERLNVTCNSSLSHVVLSLIMDCLFGNDVVIASSRQMRPKRNLL
jgi:hypothetical protein